MSAAYLRSLANTPSCSGRSSLQNSCNCTRFTNIRRPRLAFLRRGASVAVHALYNFTDSAEVRIPGQRRNRSVQKKEERELMDVVRGLTAMTSKQLAAVSHLLPPGTVEAVGIAARLPRSNQGRKRQEGLVAKMLRGQLTEQQMEKLEAAVVVVTEQQGIYNDGEVSTLVEVWREGLLEGDEEVAAEVYGYPSAWAPDHQQLRALVRQCQQALEEERAQETAALQSSAGKSAGGASSREGSGGESGGSSGSEGGEDEVDDGDEDEDGDLAAVLAEAAARSTGGSGRGGRLPRRRSKAAEPRSRPLLRSLSKMLRPLATKVVQERMSG